MENQDVLNSKCCVIDRKTVIYFTSIVIIFVTIGLSVYKLLVSQKCEESTAFFSLLSSLSGTAAGVLFSVHVMRRSGNLPQNPSMRP